MVKGLKDDGTIEDASQFIKKKTSISFTYKWHYKFLTTDSFVISNTFFFSIQIERLNYIIVCGQNVDDFSLASNTVLFCRQKKI